MEGRLQVTKVGDHGNYLARLHIAGDYFVGESSFALERAVKIAVESAILTKVPREILEYELKLLLNEHRKRS
ncbi:hypothetical protein SY88_01470 [Clostridiales bacterium PH28_bin88]|nr:hypothetical protein SY88_01470 [Clostridiales bacterium PH28_bin88]